MSGRSIVLAAGGTGGHLFPALALAQELKSRGHEIDLMTDMRGGKFDGEFPAREIFHIPSATIKKRNPASLFETTWMLSKGCIKARGILRKISPDVVLGFGGYPTVPPLLAASWLGLSTAVHEQNAVMGRANRLLSKRVNAIATSFEVTQLVGNPPPGKVHFTGNPVRQDVRNLRDRPYRRLEDCERIILLIFGGSQGARFFSDVVPEALTELSTDFKGRLQVVQQCRREDLTRVDAAYSNAGIEAKINHFFSNLPELMADSHLIISRSGASTAAELCVIGRPALMVPLPHALDNDQLLNATQIAEHGGGWFYEQSELTKHKLREILTDLFSSPEKLARAARQAWSLGKPDAVNRLAKLIEALASEKRNANSANSLGGRGESAGEEKTAE